MKTVSTKLEDDDARRFERIVLAMRLQGEDVSMSGIIRSLVLDWMEENEDALDGIDLNGLDGGDGGSGGDSGDGLDGLGGLDGLK